MKYSVDRIENDIAVLESLDDNTIINVPVYKFNFKVYENDILVYKDNIFIKDETEKEKRIISIREKMNMLRKEG